MEWKKLFKKKLIMLAIIIVGLLAVSAVSATDNITDNFNDFNEDVEQDLSINANSNKDFNGIMTSSKEVNDYEEGGCDSILGDGDTNITHVRIQAQSLVVDYGKDTNFTARLSDSNNNSISGVFLNFKLNGKYYKSLTDNNGCASITVNNLNVGNYVIQINYANTTFSKKITVNNPLNYMALDLQQVAFDYGKARIGCSIYYEKVDDLLYNKIITLKFSNGKKINVNTGSLAVAFYTLPFAPGKYKVTLTFSLAGKSLSKNYSIKIIKATPKLTAAKKTFKKSVKTKKYTVTLKNNLNKLMKSTLVTLNVNKKIYKVKTNAKGQATFKINNLNKKGTFTAVVKFAGNKYYNAKTVKAKIIVK